MISLQRSHKYSILLISLCLLLYYFFAYQLERTEFYTMSLLWLGLFLCSFQLIQKHKKDIKTLAVLAILFRIVFLLAIPNLSQDFYRFLWDGRMLLNGHNPYLSLPANWVAQGNAPIMQADELYRGMGTLNGSHYTNYPPISQFCYWIAALFAKDSIWGGTITLRIIIILADIGTFYIGKKLLKSLQLPEHQIFWYILNPFIIIELTGNLHFESVMVFFVILSTYLLHKKHWYWAAIALGISISVKLVPLLFLPLFFQKFITGIRDKSLVARFAKLIGFYSLTLLSVGLLFAPFLSASFITNFSKTISLWFQNFEFNASIYYIIRWIGYQTIGWNIIASVGKILPLIVIGILLLLTFFRKNKSTTELITVMLLGICSYYFLSTTVHPWYLAVPIGLCIFTKYKFPLVWSIVIILSYAAYIHPSFKENLWMVSLEYIIVFSVFFFEIYKNTKRGSVVFLKQ